MTPEADLAKAVKQAEKDEADRFKAWKKIQEDAGYTVTGDSLATAVVSELPAGPTFDDTPGS